MAAVSADRELRRFRRGLRWFAPAVLVVALVLGAVEWVREDAGSGVTVFAMLVLMGVAIAPLWWIRYEAERPRRPEDRGPWFRMLGLAVLRFLAMPSR
jgi:hypothetical protein